MHEKLKQWESENGEHEGYTYRGYFIIKNKDYRGEWDINTVVGDGYWKYLKGASTLRMAKFIVDTMLETP
jgi:hypothetical protein